VGANGETVPNAEINLTYSVVGVDEVERKQLRTDYQGQIQLGKLSIVKKISADINNSDASVLRVWAIRSPES
jgi:hypothetical protein